MVKLNLDFFFLFFSFLSIISSFCVILSKNPLHSVIFLIFVFCNVVLILLLQGIDFLAMVFLIVYIGAIAVLFLFVVYMLNIKLIEVNELNRQYLFGLFVSLFFFSIFVFVFFTTQNSNFYNFETNFDFFIWLNVLFDIQNLRILALILYLDFYLIFIIIGLILLVAMLGAIVLTSKRTFFLKEQQIFQQNNRFIK
jgi:NADH-quinone oxidoreductase subunit J